MTTMIGYYQRGLVGHAELLVEHQLHQCALTSGGPLTEVFVEEPTRPTALWTLLVELDRRHDANLVETITALAERDGIDLSQLQGQPDSSQLGAALATLASTGGHLVVPHLGHLDNLGIPRRTLMERFNRPGQAIGLIDASSPPHTVAGHRPLGRVIGEFCVAPVSPATEIAEMKTRRILGLAGISNMVPVVERLMHELVDALLEPSHVLGQGHRLTVQLALNPAGIVVACWDTRDYAGDPLGRAVTDACCGGRVVRNRWGTGTETRCEIPFPAADLAPSRPIPGPRAIPVQAR
ncbi:hypothetical protein [Nocardia neocaledoniensis]|uniref:hypothetical protein n=1 Tax=Nocardia neocaledoniensis TaxID=236511 RepID=UPI0024549739|nr:hypothetical protein [Nocardia neocaledoniensis]